MDLLADKTHLGILRAQAIAFEEERYKEHITRGGTSRERTGNSTDVSSLAPSPLLKSEIPVEYNGADNTILPRNHWAYHAIDTLQHAGIVIANVGTYDGNSMSFCSSIRIRQVLRKPTAWQTRELIWSIS